ncbi:hypothetical protein ABW20_dc0110294 [Dactylellina cionopaga]|nr:hypothetical protein ABW20_dc0110294 [Dactylellina cionopaga]
MAVITSLPVEILFQIFTDNSVASVSDNAHIRRVCRLFDAIAQPIPTIYTFKVDTATHLPWKLARHLLVHPKIAERFKEIRVEWYRRDIDSTSQKWSKRWHWTLEETDKIKELTRAFNLTRKTTTAILAGVNSEALLPLLLCFTTTLSSLQMGAVEPQLIRNSDRYYKSQQPRKVKELLYIIPDDSSVAEISETQRKAIEATYGREDSLEDNTVSTPGQTHTWFHENLRCPGKWLPGLLNLQYFTHGFTSQFFDEFHYGMGMHYIFPIFFLPKIHTIKANRFANLHDNTEYDITPDSYSYGERDGEDDDGEWYLDLKSPVKRLEFQGYFWENHIDELAGYTGNLEYICLEDPEGYIHPEFLRNSFLKHNINLPQECCIHSRDTG